MEDVAVVNEFMDTVFRMITKNPEELLRLSNAINKTHYTNVGDLEITTLENAIYMHMKNDVSCLLDMHLQLYEQQSTVNPNMPLRDLLYVAAQYQKLVVTRDIYSSKLLKIPTPKFIVFYNGVQKQPERRELRLSAAFEKEDDNPSLELKVLQLNINSGYNQELMDSCPTLFEYMCYVNKVREYRKVMPLAEAVKRAVDECIEEDVLREFLLANKAEVLKVSIYEYNEELHLKTLRQEGYEDGVADGKETGKYLSMISLICKKIQKGKSLAVIAEELEEDVTTVEKIYNIAQGFAPDYNVEDIYQAFVKN